MSSEAAGRLLGLATGQPVAVGVLEDLLVAGRGLCLVQRPANPIELGGPPRPSAGLMPVAVVRDGRPLAFDAPGYQQLEAGDVVVSLSNEAT